MEMKSRFNKVFVLCPANYVTGGPDALHQIVFYLNGLGVNSTIAYIADGNSDIEIPQPYKVYINSFVTNFRNLEYRELVLYPFLEENELIR